MKNLKSKPGIYVRSLKRIYIPQAEAEMILNELKKEFSNAQKQIEEAYQVKITLVYPGNLNR
jgi:hypothetical protein